MRLLKHTDFMDRKIKTAAIVGAGYMGGGIAQVLALSGIEVQLADAEPQMTQKSLLRLISESEQFERDGLFNPGAAEIVRERVHAADSIEAAVASADFVEEAVPEIPEIKHSVLHRISQAVSKDTIVGSNTSTLPIAGLAEAFTDRSRFFGVHFSNPAPFIPGVEIIPHSETNPEVLSPVEEMLRRAGKIPARLKDAAGFVLNRLQYVLFKEATRLVEEGVATPEAIDLIVRTTFGFRLPFFGPFVIADMAGLDVYAASFKTMEQHFGERLNTPEMLAELVAKGHLGTKAGGGFLNISSEKTAELIAYRNRAYHKLAELLKELGPAPVD
ncbi:MAG: 3-hydroxyacyl-CoA dehydrogenase family protein [Verrucomicrobia bacterium]|nr:3-hydroxyacyl-CoA dehydrogenase family protein [Verrucomicrobiota bacterium]